QIADCVQDVGDPRRIPTLHALSRNTPWLCTHPATSLLVPGIVSLAAAQRARRVLLGEALEEPLDAALPGHLLELRAVGHHEAHSLYRDVVDFPALGRLAHCIVDRDRRLPGPDVLVAHGHFARAGLRI